MMKKITVFSKKWILSGILSLFMCSSGCLCAMPIPGGEFEKVKTPEYERKMKEQDNIKKRLKKLGNRLAKPLTELGHKLAKLSMDSEKETTEIEEIKQKISKLQPETKAEAEDPFEGIENF